MVCYIFCAVAARARASSCPMAPASTMPFRRYAGGVVCACLGHMFNTPTCPSLLQYVREKYWAFEYEEVSGGAVLGDADVDGGDVAPGVDVGVGDVAQATCMLALC